MSHIKFTVVLLISVTVRGVPSLTLPEKSLDFYPNEMDNSEKEHEVDLGVLLKSLFDASLNIYAPVSHAFDNDLCRNHSLLYRDGVRSKKLWALTMYDASSKLSSGVLTGNRVQLGNYDECLEVEDVDSDYGRFSGQHCMVALGEDSFYSEMAIHNKMDDGLQTLDFHKRDATHEEYKYEDVPHMGTMWSVCIPSSCRPRDLELHLRASLSQGLGNTHIRVHQLACNSRADPKPTLTVGDGLAIFLLLGIVLLVASSTIYDVIASQESTRDCSPVLLAFSLRSNARQLFHSTRPSELPVLDGVRVISMLWVILFHHYILSIYRPTINHNRFKQFTTDWMHLFTSNGSLSVDSFFLLSGVLVCHNYLDQRSRGVRFDLLQYYVHRYIRLTPTYAFMTLVCATVVKYSGDGPFFKVNLVDSQISCSEIGWYSLIYMVNYLDKHRLCLGVAWSLSVDMQLFWMSPLILYPLWSRPKYGKVLLGIFLLGGLTIAFLVPYMHDLQLQSAFFFVNTSNSNMLQYFPTHTRFTPWVVGIALGYYLHTSKTAPPAVLPRGVVISGWVLGVCLLLVPWLLGHHFIQPHYQYDRLTSSLFTAFSRPAFALGLAWIIYACSLGYGGFLNRFLTWSIFQVLSRLCYAVLFTHYNVLLEKTLMTKVPLHLNDTILMIEYIGVTVISFGVALVLCLTVEMPFINLGRQFLFKQVKIKRS